MSSSLKNNILYSYIYQLLIIILPLITAPYVSRVLGPNGVGEYAYYYSIAQYFLLFVMMGIVNYGSRAVSISISNNSKQETKRIVSEIYLIQISLFIVISITYLILNYLSSKNPTLSTIMYLVILSGGIDISWLYFGLEKFKTTVTRNLIIKILSFILIFCIVKNKDDINNYALIITLSTLLSQLYLWLKLPIKINLLKSHFKIIHLKKIIILFIPVLAYSIYKIMDKIMLGNLSSLYELGLFDNSEKISFLPLGFITAVGTVMMPRMSKVFHEKNNEKINQYLDISFKLITYLSLAISLGLMCISQILAPVFFGKAFTDCAMIIGVLSLSIPFISWANIIRTQHLMPQMKDKIYVISSIYGAIINFSFNLYLIPKYGAIGAGYSTILAEFSVFLYMAVKTNQELHFFKRILNERLFLLAIIGMSIIIYGISSTLNPNLSSLISIILIGTVLFGIVILYFILKDPMLSSKIRSIGVLNKQK